MTNRIPKVCELWRGVEQSCETLFPCADLNPGWHYFSTMFHVTTK